MDKTLSELEMEERYLFHGSGLHIDRFEPRQSYSHIDGKQIPDGQPAIFASQFKDYAIFMALINKQNCPQGYQSSCGSYDGILVFGATKETLDQLSDTLQGYVYVFDRKDFTQRNSYEWMRHEAIEPLEIIKVIRADFKPEISIIK